MANLDSVHHLHHPPLSCLSQSLAAQLHAVVDVDSGSLMVSVRLAGAAPKLWDGRWLLSSAGAARTGVSTRITTHLNGTAMPPNDLNHPAMPQT